MYDVTCPEEDLSATVKYVSCIGCMLPIAALLQSTNTILKGKNLKRKKIKCVGRAHE